MAQDELDVVGPWTEVKLRILKDYSAAYAQILGKQTNIKHFAYIDGFAGAGTHISKTTGQKIPGSPQIALSVQPPFSHYHFIDLDGNRTQQLRELAGTRSDVTVYSGDCNSVLVNDVFPQCRYDQFRRALCLLDPYKLNPDWHVMASAGKMRSIEIFLNFMIMDANMNVLKHDPSKVSKEQADRMTAFWGDDSWRQAGYTKERGLFGEIEEKTTNENIVAAYAARLKEVAGFPYVPRPLPMKNKNGAIVYYILFASHNKTGDKIARSIFEKYRNHGL